MTPTQLKHIIQHEVGFKHGSAAPVESEPLYMAEDFAGDESWPAAQ